MNCALVIDNIVNETIKYLDEHPKLESLILGVSGGIDSALVAVLAHKICCNYRTRPIKLYGYSLPCTSNKLEETDRADKIGKEFCNKYVVHRIDKLYNATLIDIDENNFISVTESDFASKIRKGNIKARLRMIYLYNQASAHKGMVLSTDNLTEYYEGFWTLNGDVGSYGFIQNLWKTEVYELSKYLVNQYLNDGDLGVNMANALQLCIDAVPTDGLGITSSDLEQLGGDSYAEVDELLQKYLYLKINALEVPLELLNHPVIQKHISTEFKRHLPYNITREQLEV